MPMVDDWGRLITLLRRTYNHGDGGLSSDSGIAPDVLTDGLGGVHSLKNGLILWNLAVERLTDEEIDSCIACIGFQSDI